MLKKIILILVISSFAVPAFAQDIIPSAKDIYMQNENALSKEYADKPLVVQGIVISAGPNMYGLPAINLSDHEQGQMLVMCVLPFDRLFSLGDIESGQEITVSGEYRGSLRGAKDGYAILKQCSIVGQ